MGGRPMDENLIHRYLAESPFFDHTTKNGLVVSQSRTNQPAFDLVRDRKRFEEQLRRQRGVEYLIAGEPQDVGRGEAGYAEGGRNGMWVIRKQDRERLRLPDGRFEEQLTTLGTYYVVGENLYQAPSVGDVVGNRFLSAATSLNKFLDQASSLPSFSPTAGYSYLPHQNNPASASSAAAAGAGASAAGSPTHSREGSVAPNTETHSLRSTSLAPDSQTSGTATGQQTSSSAAAAAASQESRLLASSLKMALEFENEYMDENPLLGEPGHFSFTTSAAAVKKRKADEVAAEAAAAARRAEELQQRSSGASPAVAVKSEKPPSPPAVMTESKATAAVKVEREKGDRRGSRMERVKRKKSRTASVVTPTSAVGMSAPPG